MRWKFSVGDIINQHWNKIQHWTCLTTYAIYMLNIIRKCRTADLGGNVNLCDQCGHYQIAYNSCRNRHCPTCQGLKREEWIAKQEAQLLPVPYFHVVFTLPHELNGLSLAYPRILYNLLFQASWQTIQAFAKDPKLLGAKTGMTAVLHTWGQNLSLHPHLHCIVPGGGITKNGTWKTTRSEGKYLFPKKALRKVFKGKFMEGLKLLAKQGAIQLPFQLKEKLFALNWVVYAKRPFSNSKAVIEYLGRYTHKVAISNYRIKALTDHTVTFDWKNYKKGGEVKPMTLQITEFVRRFTLHFLPKGFIRIKHYGILSSRGRACYIPDLQKKMQVFKPRPTKQQIKDIAFSRMKINNTCPCCSLGKMTPHLPFGRDGPPEDAYMFFYISKL